MFFDQNRSFWVSFAKISHLGSDLAAKLLRERVFKVVGEGILEIVFRLKIATLVYKRIYLGAKLAILGQS